ncbi:MAG: hypothetical protein BWY31_00846 [Lentisphaerae bacterium ADurb.Bin242]|nr:MAG: hypothetical protein BWY31_00846 [Lentisphaerae bacterium ADurb.Bin242]
MPVLARFYGMVVKMYLQGKEHGMAHIHVIYGECAGVIDVKTGQMLEGDLPAKALTMVREWTAANRDALLEMWETQSFRQLLPLE